MIQYCLFGIKGNELPAKECVACHPVKYEVVDNDPQNCDRSVVAIDFNPVTDQSIFLSLDNRGKDDSPI
jgi:hypothetical protein